MRAEFGWTANELHRQLMVKISEIQLPFWLFTNEKCADIVLAEIKNDKVRLSEIYHQAELRFKKQYRNSVCL